MANRIEKKDDNKLLDPVLRALGRPFGFLWISFFQSKTIYGCKLVETLRKQAQLELVLTSGYVHGSYCSNIEQGLT
jgi:hypothetical protein